MEELVAQAQGTPGPRQMEFSPASQAEFVICDYTIECLFGRMKHFRRVATRYEKTARNYLAILHVASIMVLLR